MSTINKSGSSVGRLIFTNNNPTNLFNAYTPGAGVGATSISVRRALKRKASLSAGTMTNPKPIPGAPCCPEISKT